MLYQNNFVWLVFTLKTTAFVLRCKNFQYSFCGIEFIKFSQRKEEKGRIVDRGQWTVDSGQWTVDSGQRTVDSGQWTVDSGQWTVDSGQWTEDRGQRTVDSGQWKYRMKKELLPKLFCCSILKLMTDNH